MINFIIVRLPPTDYVKQNYRLIKELSNSYFTSSFQLKVIIAQGIRKNGLGTRLFYTPKFLKYVLDGDNSATICVVKI